MWCDRRLIVSQATEKGIRRKEEKKEIEANEIQGFDVLILIYRTYFSYKSRKKEKKKTSIMTWLYF